MDRKTLTDVWLLSSAVRGMAGKLLKGQKNKELPVQGGPDVAFLKRASMDLTRALARLRGRGRF